MFFFFCTVKYQHTKFKIIFNIIFQTMAKAINSRDRMDPAGAKCMQKLAVLIEKNVEAKDITSFLYSKGALTFDEKVEIENERPRRERIRLLTNRIMSHGGENAFSAFLEALQDANYVDLRVKLHETMQATDKPPDIVSPNAPTREKFNNEWARRKTTENKMNFLRAKVMSIEETLESKLKEDPTIIQVLDDIKDLIHESVETTNGIIILARQLEQKEIKLKIAEQKINYLEEMVQTLKKEKVVDRAKINKLEREMKTLKENDKDNNERLIEKDEEIAALQGDLRSHEDRLQNIEDMLRNTHTQQEVKPRKEPKPVTTAPRNRFQ